MSHPIQETRILRPILPVLIMHRKTSCFENRVVSIFKYFLKIQNLDKLGNSKVSLQGFSFI